MDKTTESILTAILFEHDKISAPSPVTNPYDLGKKIGYAEGLETAIRIIKNYQLFAKPE